MDIGKDEGHSSLEQYVGEHIFNHLQGEKITNQQIVQKDAEEAR